MTVCQLVGSERHQQASCVSCSLDGVGLILELSDMSFRAIDRQAGYPGAAPLVPVHAAPGGGAPCVRGEVLAIRRPRANPQVASTVVQSVAVLVVNFDAVSRHEAEQLTMQEQEGLSPSAPLGALRVAGGVQAPLPLSCPRGVGAVDERVRPKRSVASLQGDRCRQSVRAKRHGECMSGSPTCVGTVQRPANHDLVGQGKEVGAACFADARNGRLLGHSESPLGMSRPRTVSAVAGVFARQFYHIFLSGRGPCLAN